MLSVSLHTYMYYNINWKSTHATNRSSMLPSKPTLRIHSEKAESPGAASPLLQKTTHGFHRAFETRHLNTVLHPGKQNSAPKLLPFPEMHLPSSLRISLRSFTLAVVTLTANLFSASEI